MAIERGVDDVDIDELDIDDNSKEILVSATPEEGGMFDEVEGAMKFFLMTALWCLAWMRWQTICLLISMPTSQSSWMRRT